MRTQQERIAFICTAKSCEPRTRVFADAAEPVPSCPEHGPMKRQENKAYTPPPEAVRGA